jgi:uncharacterized protein
VDKALRDFIAERTNLLRDRAAAGWVREGHGDLRAEHICLEPDGAVQVFDCVEFSRSLRCADVASDLAFLLMDLDRLGEPGAADTLAVRYRSAGFDMPESLLSFYKAHRALVRAKIACLSRAFAHRAVRDDLALEATEYLNLATANAVSVRPTLIAMTGLSGTGKSTVAAALARALGAPVFSSDSVRKELAGRAEPAPAPWEQGLYGPEHTEATYGRLEELARETLATRRPAILDATFLDERRRERLAAVAEEAGVPLVLVETVCAEEVALGRIVARARRGVSPSDATAEVYRRQRATVRTSPPNVPCDALRVVVDTSAGHPVCLDPVFVALRRWGIVAARVPATEVADK